MSHVGRHCGLAVGKSDYRSSSHASVFLNSEPNNFIP